MIEVIVALTNMSNTRLPFCPALYRLAITIILIEMTNRRAARAANPGFLYSWRANIFGLFVPFKPLLQRISCSSLPFDTCLRSSFRLRLGLGFWIFIVVYAGLSHFYILQNPCKRQMA